jgi:hypothetical protein
MTDKEKLKKIVELRREKGRDQEGLELLYKLLTLKIDFKKQIHVKPVSIELKEKRLLDGEPLVRREELALDITQFVNHWRDVEKIFRDQAILGDEATNPEQYLREFIEGRGGLLDLVERNGEKGELLHYILLEVLKPLYETYGAAYGKQPDDGKWVQPFCYVCGGRPDMAMLVGDGGKRYLCCGLCDTSWWYAKLKCPHCGNEDLETLVSLTLEHLPTYIIQGCKACNRYVKVVDARVGDGALFLELEDLQTTQLDGVARNEGFRPY